MALALALVFCAIALMGVIGPLLEFLFAEQRPDVSDAAHESRPRRVSGVYPIVRGLDRSASIDHDGAA